MNPEQLANLYQQNKSIGQIATIAGLSRPTVRKRLLAHGVQLRNYSEVLVARSNQDRRLHDYDFMYDARITKQLSIEAIAKQLGTTFKYVKQSLIDLGIPYKRMNESKYYNAISKQQLIDLYHDHTFDQIAEKLECSPATISRFFQKYNIETKTSTNYPQTTNRFKSCQEMIISNWITDLGFEVINDYRQLGGSYDIYVPAAGLLIEYNGLYWHSDQHKAKDLHVRKTNVAEQHNLRLFHVWEDDWLTRQPIVKSMIINMLGITPIKLAARKCVVKMLDVSTARQFYDQNHIQQFAPASFHLGLYYNDDLVSAASFRRARFTKKYQWELIRMVTRLNTVVRGGSSKLINAFCRQHRGTIVSYADRTYSNGNVYKQLGFELMRTNPISYWYVINTNRVSRTMFTKSKLPSNKFTEKQTSDILGIPRIWNSGIQTWVLNNV